MTLILWSGGCDSTLALWMLGKEHGGRIRALSVVHPQVNAACQQKCARLALKPKLCRLIGVDYFPEQTVVVEHKDPGTEFDAVPARDNGGNGLTQPGFWLPLAVAMLEPGEDLALGYISGDGIWHYRHHFEQVFIHLQAIRGGKGRLVFPLEYTTKTEVVGSLRELRLLDDCWFCEQPHGVGNVFNTLVSCRKCKPCVRHAMALKELDEFGNKHVDEFIQHMKAEKGTTSRKAGFVQLGAEPCTTEDIKPDTVLRPRRDRRKKSAAKKGAH